MSKEQELKQDVLHITTPREYFPSKVADKPIFGISAFGGLEFKPIVQGINGRAVFYMTDKVRTDPDATMLKDTMDRDLWEYMRFAQLDMAGKFEDTLAFRKSTGQPHNHEVYLGLQYLMLCMLRYSNFNFLIDFNELNRISLEEPTKARREMFVLIAAAEQNINWAIAKNSKLNNTNPTIGRDLFLETLSFKAAPPLVTKDIDKYLLRYDFMRDEVLRSQSSTPWAVEEFEDVSAEQITNDFKITKSICAIEASKLGQPRER